jgi:hypothetical protein
MVLGPMCLKYLVEVVEDCSTRKVVLKMKIKEERQGRVEVVEDDER